MLKTDEITVEKQFVNITALNYEVVTTIL